MGADFLPYLIPTATGEILRYFRDHAWAIRPPRRLSDLHGAINRVIDPLTHDLSPTPHAEEIAQRLGVEQVDVVDASHAARGYRALSLDVLVGESEVTLGEVLCRAAPGLEGVEARHVLGQALTRLPERDRGMLGLSQMHLSRLLTAILQRLRLVLRGVPALRGVSHDDCPSDRTVLCR